MTLTAIVAMTPERIIGKDGDLPWILPDDLKFFKQHTSGHPIVMGRKTFDSIGRPLPKRQNIVITRDPAWNHNGVETIHHPKELNEFPLIDQQVFIIGGEEIYRFFLPILNDIIITHVPDCYEGDTFFPQYEHLFPNSELIWEQ
ncbi:dihydrofolate reductase, partial [bacterium]|nr:dihydrofolate reductase [bacterium]